MRHVLLLLLIGTITSCISEKKQEQTKKEETEKDSTLATEEYLNSIDYDVSQWNEITTADGVILDLRYATDNNFTKKQIYPCSRCFLRPALAEKIRTLQNDIAKRYGYKLKLFDCYRPRPAQQKLWDIVPNETYVTNPAKGSMHNRGLAIDITLVDKEGKELDMGTSFDFFGRKAHTDFYDLPPDILKNRELLSKLMDIHGLKGIQSEWWHYSLKTVQAPLDDWEWPCES